MARIPDLDAPATSVEAEAAPSRPHGRMLSPSLSIKLLAAGAVLLVLGALIPYAMNREEAPRDPRPAPGADEAPAFVGGPTQTPNGQSPKGQAPAPVVQQAPPDMSFKPKIPAAPTFKNPAKKPAGPRQANGGKTGPQAKIKYVTPRPAKRELSTPSKQATRPPRNGTTKATNQPKTPDKNKLPDDNGKGNRTNNFNSRKKNCVIGYGFDMRLSML